MIDGLLDPECYLRTPRDAYRKPTTVERISISRSDDFVCRPFNYRINCRRFDATDLISSDLIDCVCHTLNSSRVARHDGAVVFVTNSLAG